MASQDGRFSLRRRTLRNRGRRVGGGFELSGEFRKQGIVVWRQLVFPVALLIVAEQL